MGRLAKDIKVICELEGEIRVYIPMAMCICLKWKSTRAICAFKISLHYEGV